jgi:hypothetical protein
MRFLNRKSKLERLLETVGDSLDPANVLKGALSDGLGSGKPLKDGLLPTGKSVKAVVPRGRALKAGLVAGGLAGLTAGSARISSLRRRREGAAGHP